MKASEILRTTNIPKARATIVIRNFKGEVERACAVGVIILHDYPDITADKYAEDEVHNEVNEHLSIVYGLNRDLIQSKIWNWNDVENLSFPEIGDKLEELGL